MAFAADYAVLLDRLDDELQAAPEAARGVFAKIISSACSRIPVLSKSGKTARMERLIESGAWTDAAIALIESEMPGWKMRRLVYENGEWFCSLSRQPNMPADLDDSADAAHPVLPLAILRAFVEARRRSKATIDTAAHAALGIPQLQPAAGGVVCCDNFA
jgi:hypothetical protein